MNITVYAASSGQASDTFLRAARELGAELARRGIVARRKETA